MRSLSRRGHCQDEVTVRARSLSRLDHFPDQCHDLIAAETRLHLRPTSIQTKLQLCPATVQSILTCIPAKHPSLYLIMKNLNIVSSKQQTLFSLVFHKSWLPLHKNWVSFFTIHSCRFPKSTVFHCRLVKCDIFHDGRCKKCNRRCINYGFVRVVAGLTMVWLLHQQHSFSLLLCTRAVLINLVLCYAQTQHKVFRLLASPRHAISLAQTITELHMQFSVLGVTSAVPPVAGHDCDLVFFFEDASMNITQWFNSFWIASPLQSLIIHDWGRFLLLFHLAFAIQ